MSVYSRVAKFAYKKVGRKLTAKQLSAARRNIKKAIIASAKKRKKSISKGLRQPLKTYGGSVTRRTIRKRAKRVAKLKLNVKSLQTSNASLSKVLKEQNRVLSVTKGSKALNMRVAEMNQANLQKAVAKLNKKGSDGLFGAMRKRQAAVAQRNLNRVTQELNADRSIIKNLSRQVAITDGRIALQTGAINDATAKYISLSKAPNLLNKARTVAGDATLIASVGAAGYAINSKRKNKKT